MRKSRHDMASFAKGMATTIGWTLVLCDCKNRIHQAANDLLVRDEGGSSNLFMKVATYKQYPSVNCA